MDRETRRRELRAMFDRNPETIFMLHAEKCGAAKIGEFAAQEMIPAILDAEFPPESPTDNQPRP